MRQIETTPKNPVNFKRTKRPARARVLTSGDAGKSYPIRFEPVNREESVSGRVGVTIEMAETPEIVSNAVHAKCLTYFVPYLAFEQFKGSIEELNKRYMGSPSLFGDGQTVEPFFVANNYWDGSVEKQAGFPWALDTSFVNANGMEFYTRAGIHLGADDINNSYVQAYNCLHNYRRKSRSPQLAQRNQYDHTFAECFWPSAGMSPIVAAYDEKLIAGEVKLRDLTFKAPVGYDVAMGGTNDLALKKSANPVDPDGSLTSYVEAQKAGEPAGQLWAELSEGANSSMSLADIDQARKTAAFAKLRALYSGNTNYGDDDDFLIDLLMQGIRIPVEMMKDPILVGRSEGTFNMQQRYATDGANLDASATNGMISLSHRVAVPQTNVGGILVTVVEIAPERIWERSKEHFLQGVKDANQLPNALVDYLDPEKVEVVTKDHLDVQHTQGAAILGYQPKNSHWRRNDVRVGGKFFRPNGDAYVQDRARIWSTEVTDPELSTDFYLTTDVNKKVFADQASDGFEILLMQDLKINTNIQFGDMLLETDGTSDYDAITNQVDADQGEV
jgi:hypothetical protein